MYLAFCDLRCYTAYIGNSLPTFRDNLTVPIFKDQEIQEDFLTFEDGTVRLSRNVGDKLPLHAT